jgi:hypothetical protein
VARRIETLDVRPAVPLAGIQRGVGVVDDLVPVGARLGERRDPDRDRERASASEVASERRG